MCLCPITIPNKTRRFVRGLSRPLLTVACGHCAECAARQQDDWFVRALFETKRVERLGGAVWVPILTYRNEDLPVWHDDEFNYHIPCFDPIHIKRFRDRLRVCLTRDLYLRHGELVSRRKGSTPIYGDTLIWNGRNVSGENTIRYITCCEYGDERGRSHIHSLLFVPFFVPVKVMRYVIDYAWTYGMVRYSKLGMMARGLRAARYSMKYISKDMCWSTKYGTDAYEDMLKTRSCFSASREECEKYKERLNAFRRVKPRHFQSMGFGIDGVDYFRNDDGSWNYERCLYGKLDGCRLGVPPLKSGESFQYEMPMYYVRKIFYNVDEWNLYRLSDFGLDIFAARFNLTLKREAEKYQVYMNQSDLAAHVAFLDGVNPVELYNKIHTLMDGRNAFDLALFNIVYKNISGTTQSDEDISNGKYAVSNEGIIANLNSGMSDRQSLKWLYDISLDFMLAQKSIDREPDPEHSYLRSHANIELGFNDVPCFRDFGNVLSIIQDIETKIGELEQKAAEIKRERERKIGLYQDNYISSNLIFCDL